MKEATGELSMVVITIVAVIAILVLWQIMSPTVTNWVQGKFGDLTGRASECGANQHWDTSTKSCVNN